MANIVVIPKRKTLKPTLKMLEINEFQPPEIVIPSVPSQGITALSQLLIDISKNWLGYSIENIGSPSDEYGAVSKYDLPTAIEFVIDGGGVVIDTGQKGHVRLPFAGTIISAALAADQVGSMVIDIWKDTLANFPPTDEDSICGGNEPTLSSDDAMLDAVLTDWTKTFDFGDWFAFNVDSCATITRVTLVLVLRRS